MSEKVKNQLHQLLAVENDRKQKSLLIIQEGQTTFSKRVEHFDGLSKVYTPNTENGEGIPPELKEIVTTVKSKIEYMVDPISEGIDAQISKEETNSSGNARTDLIVDGKHLGTLSATSLLALETWIVKIREMYKEIPTLDPTRNWVEDKKAGVGIFQTLPEVKYRTNKVTKPIVLYPATDKHPAQVTTVNEDIQVGKYETIYKSGRITPAQKSKILVRIDKILDAVKNARAIANQADVVNVKIGSKIFDFINGSDL